MLKALIQVECDACNKQFFFARSSACEPNAWNSNITALTAMLEQYHWASPGDKVHFCLECWGEIAAPLPLHEF